MGPTANPNTTRLVARVMTSVETWNSLEVTTVAVEKTLLAKVIHMVRDDMVIVISHLRQTGMLRGSSGSSGPSQPTRLDSRSPGSRVGWGLFLLWFSGGSTASFSRSRSATASSWSLLGSEGVWTLFSEDDMVARWSSTLSRGVGEVESKATGAWRLLGPMAY